MTSSVTGTLVAWEFRYFFLNTRQVIFLPLLLAAVLLTMWPSIGSPYVPVFLVVFLGTEREYNNTLNRWPAQLAAMILLPVDWPGAVRAKNLTTILITLVVTMCASIVVLYFAPGIPSAEHTLLALLYLLSVIFPLLSAGNARSIHSPRPGAAVDPDDLPEAVISLATLGIASIPFGILWGILESLILTFLYTGGTILYWILVSVPKTAAAVASFTDHGRVIE